MRYLAIFAGCALDIWLAYHLEPSIEAGLLGFGGMIVAALATLDLAVHMVNVSEAQWDTHNAIERARRAARGLLR